MPRDGKLFTREPLKPGLAGLAQLRDELRKPMPENWDWDYTRVENNCCTAGCAIGLTRKLWPEQFSGSPFWEDVTCKAFDLSGDEVKWIFAGQRWGNENLECVMPTMVADEIDKLLKEKGYA